MRSSAQQGNILKLPLLFIGDSFIDLVEAPFLVSSPDGMVFIISSFPSRSKWKNLNSNFNAGCGEWDVGMEWDERGMVILSLHKIDGASLPSFGGQERHN